MIRHNVPAPCDELVDLSIDLGHSVLIKCFSIQVLKCFKHGLFLDVVLVIVGEARLDLGVCENLVCHLVPHIFDSPICFLLSLRLLFKEDAERSKEDVMLLLDVVDCVF